MPVDHALLEGSRVINELLGQFGFLQKPAVSEGHFRCACRLGSLTRDGLGCAWRNVPLGELRSFALCSTIDSGAVFAERYFQGAEFQYGDLTGLACV